MSKLRGSLICVYNCFKTCLKAVHYNFLWYLYATGSGGSGYYKKGMCKLSALHLSQALGLVHTYVFLKRQTFRLQVKKMLVCVQLQAVRRPNKEVAIEPLSG